jgi:hypothetical protein
MMMPSSLSPALQRWNNDMASAAGRQRRSQGTGKGGGDDTTWVTNTSVAVTARNYELLVTHHRKALH